jgi:hypothetical protein
MRRPTLAEINRRFPEAKYMKPFPAHFETNVPSACGWRRITSRPSLFNIRPKDCKATYGLVSLYAAPSQQAIFGSHDSVVGLRTEGYECNVLAKRFTKPNHLEHCMRSTTEGG